MPVSMAESPNMNIAGTRGCPFARGRGTKRVSGTKKQLEVFIFFISAVLVPRIGYVFMSWVFGDDSIYSDKRLPIYREEINCIDFKKKKEEKENQFS